LDSRMTLSPGMVNTRSSGRLPTIYRSGGVMFRALPAALPRSQRLSPERCHNHQDGTPRIVRAGL
jgi:hypothetical protein